MRIVPRRNIALSGGEIKDFLRLFKAGQIREGFSKTEFEREFADYIGVKNMILVSSGCQGLRLILRHLNLSYQSEVIVPAYTHLSVPATIKELGFKPTFTDISLEDYNLDAELIEKRISDRTRTIIATHLFGRPCNMEKLKKIAERHNLYIIEDCGQSIGSAYKRKRTGSFGDAAYFSFHETKPFNTFGGGAVATNNDDLAQKIREEVASYPYLEAGSLVKKIMKTYLMYIFTKRLFFSFFIYPILLLDSYLDTEIISAIIENFKNSFSLPEERRCLNYQSRIGLRQLGDIDERIKAVRNNVKLLETILGKPAEDINNQDIYSSNYYYIIRAKDPRPIRKKLLRRGVDTLGSIMHNCPVYFGQKGEFPNTEKAFKENIGIPIHYNLDYKDIRYIGRVLNEALV